MLYIWCKHFKMGDKQNVAGFEFKEKSNKMEIEVQSPITYSTSLVSYRFDCFML